MKTIFAILILGILCACATSPKPPTPETPEPSSAMPAESDGEIHNDPRLKSISAAIETRNLKKLREALDPIAKDPQGRSATENALINSGLYLVTLDGLKCDAKMVNLLEKVYQGRVTKFKAVSFISVDKSDSSTPLCKDVMANSLGKMKDPAMALTDVSNYYVKLMNDKAESQIEKKAAAYKKLLTTASAMIKEACKTSETDLVCSLRPAYLAIANPSKKPKTKAVEGNANSILEILK